MNESFGNKREKCIELFQCDDDKDDRLLRVEKHTKINAQNFLNNLIKFK